MVSALDLGATVERNWVCGTRRPLAHDERSLCSVGLFVGAWPQVLRRRG